MRARQREDPEASRPLREKAMSSSRPTGPASTPSMGGGRCGCRSSPSGGAAVTDLDARDGLRLPVPHARVATAVRISDAPGPQWRRGVARTADPSVLANGAKWIWKEV
jgi:hypothetical protein